MKIPDMKEISNIVRDRLQPCLNEHHAHVAPSNDEAWLTCGEDVVTSVAWVFAPATQDELETFFEKAMATHARDAWRAIAESLVEELEAMKAPLEPA